MFKIKRRLSGAAGAPASLGSGQLAWNSVNKILYIGDGDNGSGLATSIVPVADASGSLATVSYVDGKVSALVNGAGAAFDTLKELSDALGNDANFSATVSAQISGKLSSSAVSSFMLPLLGSANQSVFRASIGAAATTHSHSISEITSLQTTLDGKLSATGTAVLAALSGSDGSGSGLDTDLVRGVTPSAFGLARLADADVNAARTGLGMGTAALRDTATVSDIRQNTANKVIETDEAWSSLATVVLTDQATIEANLNAFINAKVTLAGNRALNFSNGFEGKSGRIQFIQDATGSRTLSFTAGQCVFAGGSAPTLSTAANARDVLYYDVLDDGKVFVSLNKALS